MQYRNRTCRHRFGNVPIFLVRYRTSREELEPAVIVFNVKILSKNCLQILWKRFKPEPPRSIGAAVVGIDTCSNFFSFHFQAVALFLCNTFSSSKGSEWLMYSSTWKIDEVKINRDLSLKNNI